MNTIQESDLKNIRAEAQDYEIGFAIDKKENTVEVFYQNNPTFRRFPTVEQAECYAFGLIDAENELT